MTRAGRKGIATNVRARARALPPIAWRDQRIRELVESRAAAEDQLDQVRKELAELTTTSVDTPSFRRYVHAERRIIKHMAPRNLVDRGNVLTRKLKSYSFAQSHGVDIPQIFGIWESPADIAWDELPDQVVIKSNSGTLHRGVFPLRRVDGGWSTITTDDLITSAEIVKTLETLRAEGRADGPYAAEELLGGGVDNVLPHDVKVYAFYGEIGLVYVRAPTNYRDRSSWRFRTFLGDGSDTGPIDQNHPWFEDVPAPINFEEVMDVAKRLSINVPVPFVRVDLYDVDGRTVFGEFSPRPGGPLLLTPEHDARLGHLWERAQARLLNDTIDGANHLLKFGPGPRELKAGTGSFLLPTHQTTPDPREDPHG